MMVVAIVLRSWRHRTWSLHGDEMHALRDSIILRAGNP